MGRYFFFFSSRRRHTRSLRDWSSDVCSSDLPGRGARYPARRHHAALGGRTLHVRGARADQYRLQHRVLARSEEHTSELQSRRDLVCRLLLEKKKNNFLKKLCALVTINEKLIY